MPVRDSKPCFALLHADTDGVLHWNGDYFALFAQPFYRERSSCIIMPGLDKLANQIDEVGSEAISRLYIYC